MKDLNTTREPSIRPCSRCLIFAARDSSVSNSFSTTFTFSPFEMLHGLTQMRTPCSCSQHPPAICPCMSILSLTNTRCSVNMLACFSMFIFMADKCLSPCARSKRMPGETYVHPTPFFSDCSCSAGDSY